eukprot:jgi/Astpho2/1153/Aster-07697
MHQVSGQAHLRLESSCSIVRYKAYEQHGWQLEGQPPETAAHCQQEAGSSKDTNAGSDHTSSADSADRLVRVKLDIDRLTKLEARLKDGQEEQPEDDTQVQTAQIQHERFLALMIRTVGMEGSIAVLLGFALRVSPFGTTAPAPEHILLGVACVLPLLLADAALLLPDYSAQPRERKISLSLPQRERMAEDMGNGKAPAVSILPAPGQDEAVPVSSEEIREVILQKDQVSPVSQPMAQMMMQRTVKTKRHRNKLQETLDRVQREIVRGGKLEGLSPAQAGVVALSRHLPPLRLPAAFGHWCTDRMYEAGLGDDLDMVVLLGQRVSLRDAGMLVSLECLVAAASAFAIARAWRPIEVQMAAGKDALTLGEAGRKAKQASMEKMVQDIISKTRNERLVIAVRTSLGTFCSGLAFVLTGNVAGSLTGGSLAAGLLALYRQRRTQQLKGKKLQQVSTLLNKMRELDKVMTEKASAVLRLAGSGE